MSDVHQTELFGEAPALPGFFCWQRPGLALRHRPGWLDEADALLAALLVEVPWRQESICLFGQIHALPRLTCWMADPGCRYRYSGLEQQPAPWLPCLLTMRQHLVDLCGHDFNSLLLNLYRDGQDAMGCHADDEPELVPGASIASVSLGATRTLRFKPRTSSALAAEEAPLALELAHGDLLLMDSPTQQHWLHGLPRRQRVKTPRLNLTFRQVRAPG